MVCVPVRPPGSGALTATVAAPSATPVSVRLLPEIDMDTTVATSITADSPTSTTGAGIEPTSVGGIGGGPPPARSETREEHAQKRYDTAPPRDEKPDETTMSREHDPRKFLGNEKSGPPQYFAGARFRKASRQRPSGFRCRRYR